MAKLNEAAVNVLKANGIWILATAGAEPNAIPVFFHTVGEEQIVVFDVFMKQTLENLKVNPKVALTVFAPNMESYQIKGNATYSQDAALIEEGTAQASKMGLTVKGAVVIDVADTYVMTPGPDNGKQL